VSLERGDVGKLSEQSGEAARRATMVGPGNVHRVSGRVDVDTVAACLQQMLVELSVEGQEGQEGEDRQAIQFDLSAMEVEGSVALAMLVDVTRQARLIGKKVTFLSASEELRQIADLHGVRRILPFA
jgi:ABC-type transporter Mla MlaB component